jgi:hypothetical protein
MIGKTRLKKNILIFIVHLYDEARSATRYISARKREMQMVVMPVILVAHGSSAFFPACLAGIVVARHLLSPTATKMGKKRVGAPAFL